MMKDQPLILKLGGALLDDETAQEKLFNVLKTWRMTQKRPLLIVHGGGCLVDSLLSRLNLPVKKKNGLRVTPGDQIDIITGALAGTANKRLLAQAQRCGIDAVGLSLADGGSAHVVALSDELGHVGCASPGSPRLLQLLLKAGFLPLVSSIAVDAAGRLMNVNADQAATALALLLSADLIFLSDVSSILDAEGQRIAHVTGTQAQELIGQQIITNGMVVKVNAALKAAQALGRPVELAGWQQVERLPALLNGVSVGTRISA